MSKVVLLNKDKEEIFCNKGRLGDVITFYRVKEDPHFLAINNKVIIVREIPCKADGGNIVVKVGQD